MPVPSVYWYMDPHMQNDRQWIRVVYSPLTSHPTLLLLLLLLSSLSLHFLAPLIHSAFAPCAVCIAAVLWHTHTHTRPVLLRIVVCNSLFANTQTLLGCSSLVLQTAIAVYLYIGFSVFLFIIIVDIIVLIFFCSGTVNLFLYALRSAYPPSARLLLLLCSFFFLLLVSCFTSRIFVTFCSALVRVNYECRSDAPFQFYFYIFL